MSSSRIVRGYGLYEQLREYKPHKLHAYDADGGLVEVNVPEIRQKHARVMQALKEVSWTRVDLLDKKGGLLYRHQRNSDDKDAPATELEDIPTSPRVSELAGLMQIMLRGQELAIAAVTKQTGTMFDAYNRILETAMSRIELQSTQHIESMQLNHQLSANLVKMQLAVAGEHHGGGDAPPHSDAAVNALLPHVLKSLIVGDDKKDAKDAKDAKRRPSSSSSGAG